MVAPVAPFHPSPWPDVAPAMKTMSLRSYFGSLFSVPGDHYKLKHDIFIDARNAYRSPNCRGAAVYSKKNHILLVATYWDGWVNNAPPLLKVYYRDGYTNYLTYLEKWSDMRARKDATVAGVTIPGVAAPARLRFYNIRIYSLDCKTVNIEGCLIEQRKREITASAGTR